MPNRLPHHTTFPEKLTSTTEAFLVFLCLSRCLCKVPWARTGTAPVPDTDEAPPVHQTKPCQCDLNLSWASADPHGDELELCPAEPRCADPNGP